MVLPTTTLDMSGGDVFMTTLYGLRHPGSEASFEGLKELGHLLFPGSDGPRNLLRMDRGAPGKKSH